MQALVKENQAAVVLAGAAIPVAIAQAFRDGNFESAPDRHAVVIAAFRSGDYITSAPVASLST
jgi:uncharacterized protein YqfA (UPF0365 family)